MSINIVRNPFGLGSVAIAMLSVLGSISLSPSPLLSQEQAIVDNQADAKSTNVVDDDEYAEDESQELGIIAGSCPGQGVCVLDIVWGSPADEAGILQGDYILSFNGIDVSTPKQLIAAVKKTKAGEKAEVKLWRRGQTVQRDVVLASKADKPPASHRAWLGVMLSPTDGDTEGVMVERVMRDSPAAVAGLRGGDVIIQCDEQAIRDTQSFAESIQDMGPGTKLQLTVKRGGSQKQIEVTLGDREEAPMRFMRQAMQAMGETKWGDGPQAEHIPGDALQILEETLDDMRKRIRDLENEIREMKHKDDVSQRSSTLGDNGVMLVVQRDGRRGRDWDDRWNRGRNWDNDRYDWRGRYRRGYDLPLYRSPRYGNYYYRYDGLPYYGNFGPGYGYGYGFGRGGIRIGNFSVWW